MFDHLKTPCSTISAAAQTVILQRFSYEGHIRRMLNWRAVPIPHFTMQPLAFNLTKDVLVSCSLAVSAPLSSAKHKFKAHSCTGWSFLMLQQAGITTALVWCYRKLAVPVFTLSSGDTSLLYFKKSYSAVMDQQIVMLLIKKRNKLVATVKVRQHWFKPWWYSYNLPGD